MEITKKQIVARGVSANDFAVWDGAKYVPKTVTEVKALLNIQLNTIGTLAIPVIDMDGPEVQVFTGTGSYTFETSNRSATIHKQKLVRFEPVGADLTLGFAAAWRWAGEIPTGVPNGSTGLLTLSSQGSSEDRIVAAFELLSE